jgi:hypothetical protein
VVVTLGRVQLMLVLTVSLACAFVPASVSRAGPSADRIAREACTANATKVLVRAFVRGYDKGHVQLIDRMWARSPRFHWFSSGAPGARLGQRAYDRTTLAAYFRSRVRVHERIRLTLLRAGYDPTRDIVNFSGKLVRSARDIRRPRGPRDFKGAADCLSSRPMLIVWSM